MKRATGFRVIVHNGEAWIDMTGRRRAWRAPVSGRHMSASRAWRLVSEASDGDGSALC